MEIIENVDRWRESYGKWSQWPDALESRDKLRRDYPYVVNRRAPFVPARRALPMLNLALITSAGAYIDGTDGFDLDAPHGDVSFREIPVEVEAEDLRFAARGYDPSAVMEDINSQVPLARLFEFAGNGIIGQLNRSSGVSAASSPTRRGSPGGRCRNSSSGSSATRRRRRSSSRRRACVTRRWRSPHARSKGRASQR